MRVVILDMVGSWWSEKFLGSMTHLLAGTFDQLKSGSVGLSRKHQVKISDSLSLPLN